MQQDTKLRFQVIHENGFVFKDDHELEYRYPYLSEFEAVRVDEWSVQLPMIEKPVPIVRRDPMSPFTAHNTQILAMETEAIRDIFWQLVTIPERGIHVYKDPKLEEYDFTIPKGTKIVVRNRLYVDGQHVYELFPNDILRGVHGVNGQGPRYIGYDFYHYAFLSPPLLLLPMKGVLFGKIVNPDGVFVRTDREVYSPIVGILPANSIVYIRSKAFASLPFEANAHRYELVNGKGWINAYGPGLYSNVCIFGYAPPHLLEEDMYMNVVSVGTFRSNDDAMEGQEVESLESCISCMQQKPNAVFVHGSSGHVVCCLECAKSIQRRKMSCPLCRSKVERVIQLF